MRLWCKIRLPTPIPQLSHSAGSRCPNLVGFPFPDISSFSGVQGISAVQRDWKTPYVQNWNFNIQQAWSNDFRLQVGYVANKGTHIITPAGTQSIFARHLDPALSRVRRHQLHASQRNQQLQLDAGDLDQAHLPRASSSTSTIRGDMRWTTLPRSFRPAPMTPTSSSTTARRSPTYDTWCRSITSTRCRRLRLLPQWLGDGWQINGLTEMRSGLPINVTCGCDPLRVNQFNSRADYQARWRSGQPESGASFRIVS